ncbi:MAG TPA: hypothetical protein VGM78_11970 [Ilumatobacteraceae bacterium]
MHSAMRSPRRLAAHRFQREWRVVGVVALVVFWLIVTDWRPWDLFARGGYSSDFYDAQAHAFWHLHLAVDPKIATVEGFAIGNKVYLYFGPLLAVFRLPFTLFTHVFDGRLTRLSMLIALAVAISWSRRLFEHALAIVRPAVGDDVSDADIGRARPLLFASAVAFSPLLYGAGWTSVYHETEMWACAFAIVASVLALDLLAAPTNRRAIAAGLAAGAAILTRVTVGAGAMLVLVVVAFVLWRRRAPRWWAAASVAVAAMMIGIAINVAKFHSAFGLPWTKQVLTLEDPVRAQWFAGNNGSFFSTRFLTTTITQYLRPDTVRFERLLPFVRFGPLATNRGSYPLESSTASASLTATATLLFVLALIGFVWLLRKRIWIWATMVFLLCAGAGAAFLIGFVANRYLLDMLPPLVLAAAVGAWVVPTFNHRRAAVALGAVVAVWGLWSNASLATWAESLKEPGFTQFRYAVDHAVFGSPSPSLLAAVPASVPRDGVVLLGPQCSGVYIAEQGHWVDLERTQGVTAYNGTVSIPSTVADVVVADGDTWQLVVHVTAAGRFLQVTANGTASTSVPITSESGVLRVSVVDDPVTATFLGQVGDAVVFLPADQIAAPGQLQTPGISLDPTRRPALCTALQKDL